MSSEVHTLVQNSKDFHVPLLITSKEDHMTIAVVRQQIWVYVATVYSKCQ